MDTLKVITNLLLPHDVPMMSSLDIPLTNYIYLHCCTRSPAVAKMADRTAPVVKLTLTLILLDPPEWDGVSAHATVAKRAIIWQKQAVPL